MKNLKEIVDATGCDSVEELDETYNFELSNEHGVIGVYDNYLALNQVMDGLLLGNELAKEELDVQLKKKPDIKVKSGIQTSSNPKKDIKDNKDIKVNNTDSDYNSEKIYDYAVLAWIFCVTIFVMYLLYMIVTHFV